MALGSAVVAAYPFVGPKFLGPGTYALTLVGLTAGISALVVIPYFRGRERVSASLAAGEALIGQWTVPEADWLAWVREDDRRERGAAWRLFRTLLTWCVVIGGGFAWMDPRGGTIVLAVLLGLCAVIAGILTFRLRSLRRHRAAAAREVRVGRDGLSLGGELHLWRGFGARLEAVEVLPGHPPVLEITYSTRARNQRQVRSVRIPIPAGAEDQAAAIVVDLGAQCGSQGEP